jgi:hypothetical protein
VFSALLWHHLQWNNKRKVNVCSKNYRCEKTPPAYTIYVYLSRISLIWVKDGYRLLQAIILQQPDTQGGDFNRHDYEAFRPKIIRGRTK